MYSKIFPSPYFTIPIQALRGIDHESESFVADWLGILREVSHDKARDPW